MVQQPRCHRLHRHRQKVQKADCETKRARSWSLRKCRCVSIPNLQPLFCSLLSIIVVLTCLPHLDFSLTPRHFLSPILPLQNDLLDAIREYERNAAAAKSQTDAYKRQLDDLSMGQRVTNSSLSHAENERDGAEKRVRELTVSDVFSRWENP